MIADGIGNEDFGIEIAALCQDLAPLSGVIAVLRNQAQSAALMLGIISTHEGLCQCLRITPVGKLFTRDEGRHPQVRNIAT